MIKNEKQYKITHTKLDGIRQEIARFKAAYDEGIPAEKRLILVSLEVMKRQMEEEIAAYDHLKKKVPFSKPGASPNFPTSSSSTRSGPA
jgi:hypothetical protein